SQLRPAATWPPRAESEEPAAVELEDAGAGGAALDGAGARQVLPDADLSVPVREQGELLGILTIAKPRGERVIEIDIELLGRLAAASGVVLRNLRLDAELAQRLTDLEASRRRLLTAQNDARQRIEEDLAGGSRAQLGVLRERLSGLVREVDPATAPKTAMLLGQLVASTDGAIDTLDGLAAGVYPPRLAADGLALALTEQATKAALPVNVHAAGLGRYPAEVEAAVYFSVLEALQNIAKYACATSAQVRLRRDDDRLCFEVSDDGAGFDPATVAMGSGLQGMADRLDTVGGTMTVTSATGTGTTVTGEVVVDRAPRAAVPDPALVGASL
ncbi:MAG: ATP-binding protein, partial [Actinomycetota bacterium]|nr:ATP-binding protein [Actinomycetota bacterium]